MKKEQTRREFLKVSGTIVLLVGSGFYVPVSSGSADPKALKTSAKSSAGIPTYELRFLRWRATPTIATNDSAPTSEPTVFVVTSSMLARLMGENS